MSDLSADELTTRLALAADAVRAASPAYLQFPSHLRRDPSAIAPRLRASAEVGLAQRGSLVETISASFPDDLIISRNDPPAANQIRKLLGHCWLATSVDEREREIDAFPAFGPVVTYVADGYPTVTAIYLPQLGETITAARGLGAAIDERPLKVASITSPEKSIEVGPQQPDDVAEQIRRLAGWRVPTPEQGPLALMCYLATGRIDGFEIRLAQPDPWQLASGMLLAREAGGFLDASDLLTLQLRAASSASMVTLRR